MGYFSALWRVILAGCTSWLYRVGYTDGLYQLVIVIQRGYTDGLYQSAMVGYTGGLHQLVIPSGLYQLVTLQGISYIRAIRMDYTGELY